MANTPKCEVRLIGDMRGIASSSLKGTVPLRDLVAHPNVWGLGMPHGLNAELLILDSHCYVARFDRLRYTVSEVPGDTLVAFLATAVIAHWKPITVPESVSTFKELEAFIGTTSSDLGFPAGHPLPFRLQGKVKGLRWMVVNADSGRMGCVSIEDSFGIYSSEHRGSATNPNSNIHFHFRTHVGDQLFVGHLDDELILLPGAVLLVPQ